LQKRRHIPEFVSNYRKNPTKIVQNSNGWIFFWTGLCLTPLAMNDLFAQFDGPDVPGACVLVAEKGAATPLWMNAFGMANLTTKSPCTPATNFRLASLTKQFTAMAIMMLAERGQMKFEDRLREFFPGFPIWTDFITVHHLLTHTSGLLDYEDLIPIGTREPLKDRDVLEILRKEDRTYFEPGTSFRYSNTGYAFLALIVEAVSQKRFSAFLSDNIFEPLGMHESVAYEAGISELAHRALGYTPRGASFEETDQSITSTVLGDGGIYSSVADLFRWDQALYGETLVSALMLKHAFTDWGHGYGFGWFIDQEKVWHYGETCGFTTRIERHLKRRLAIVILCNRRDADLAPIARSLAHLPR
jgi:CubicO group peptidase (beta-lactamase class C family)